MEIIRPPSLPRHRAGRATTEQAHRGIDPAPVTNGTSGRAEPLAKWVLHRNKNTHHRYCCASHALSAKAMFRMFRMSLSQP